MLQQSGQTLPLYLPEKLDEPAPQLCGAVPPDQNYVAKVQKALKTVVKMAFKMTI